MAVRGFFYNSVNKDRLYNGQDMNEDKAPGPMSRFSTS